ncbi:sensor domain-containing diguanylate cyclase [Shewanella sp. A3A]|nr:sensor domain-containing diguanylate cyclase [Shewanella ferrihydritica]
MSLTNRQKTLLWLLTALYVVLAIVIIEFVTQTFVERQMAAEKSTVNDRLALVRSKLESAIFMDTYLADSLATVVTIDPKFAMDNWNTIGAKLLTKALYVRNVGIAPNNIISHTYPLKGNEKAIGFDFRSSPDQLRTVELARKLQTVYIAGPLELVQGGQAIIARYPIFADFPQNKQYWGCVSVVMDYPKLLQETGVIDIDGAHIALMKHDAANPTGKVIYGSAAIFEQADVSLSLKLPNGEWLIGATYDIDQAEHVLMTRTSIRAMGGTAALLAFIVLVLLYRHYRYVHTVSMQDELTHLPNRRMVMQLLDRLSAQAATDKRTFAVLNIDLNGFKKVNDELGHHVGDELLKHIAQLLRTYVRTNDVVARMGGDEFIVVLQRVRATTDIAAVADKLKGKVEAQPLIWQQHQIIPSLSIGFALYDNADISIKDLLKHADGDMYSAKKRHKAAQAKDDSDASLL